MNHAVLIITIIGLTSLASQSAIADSKKTMEVFIQLLDEVEKIDNESKAKKNLNETKPKVKYLNQPSAPTGTNNQPQPKPPINQSDAQKVVAYSKQHLGAYDEKYQNRGKKHNSDAEASKCLRFDTGRKQILNDCDFAVEALFCAINPNNPNSIHAFEMAPYFNCAENSIGMWPVGGKSPLIGKFSSDSVVMFACKKPSIPGAKYNHDSKSFSGRCSEYLSDTEPDILQYDAPF